MNEERLMKQFAENMKMEFAVKGISVYKNGNKLFGSTIDSVEIENYMALSCTTVYKDTGCKLVTRFYINADLYIMVLYSDKPDTFDGQEAEYVISDIKKLIGKIGD